MKQNITVQNPRYKYFYRLRLQSVRFSARKMVQSSTLLLVLAVSATVLAAGRASSIKYGGLGGGYGGEFGGKFGGYGFEHGGGAGIGHGFGHGGGDIGYGHGAGGIGGGGGHGLAYGVHEAGNQA